MLRLKSQDILTFNKSRALDFLLNASFDQSKPLDFKSQLDQKGKLSDYAENIKQKLEAVLQENTQTNTSSQKESENKISVFD